MAASKTIGGINVTITATTQKFQAGVNAARKSLLSFNASVGQALGSLKGLAGAFAGLSVADALRRLVMSLEGLNQAMTRSLAIMSNVSSEMAGRMRQAAIDVAKTTTFTATQAAEAYYFLASAGLNAEQSLQAMPLVAKFAAAGNFDLARATDLVTDAQSALGLSVTDATQNMLNMRRVSDVLVRANALANASVEQFSVALTNNAGAAMKTLGMDVEEGMAVLAAFADQGLKAEEAGTAFGIVTRDLQTKALANSAAFLRLGISVYDAQGEFRNMADIVGDVEHALAGMSDAQAKATLLSLGFSDKSVGYQQMLLGTSQKIRDYEAALRLAAGTTDAVAKKSLTPFQQSWAKLKGAVTDLAEALRPVLDLLTDIVGITGTLIQSFVNLGKAIAALYARHWTNLTNDLGLLKQKLGIPGPPRPDVREWLPAPTTQPVTPTARAAARAVDPKEVIAALLGAGESGLPPGMFARAQRVTKDPFAPSDSKTVNSAAIGPIVRATIAGIADASGRTRDALGVGLGALPRDRAPGAAPPLTLAESGSAESYRQQAAIRRQGVNIQQKQLKTQTGMLTELQKLNKNVQPVAAANL